MPACLRSPPGRPFEQALLMRTTARPEPGSTDLDDTSTVYFLPDAHTMLSEDGLVTRARRRRRDEQTVSSDRIGSNAR
jgi:hypothetical protein